MNFRIRVHSKGVYLHCCEKTNIMLLKIGMSYIGLLIESRRGEMEVKNAKKFEKRTTYVRNVLENLANISVFPFPYSSSSIKEMNRLFECADFWSIPSLYNLYKLSELMKEFYKYYPQAEVDGTENIWVMKPSFSSRGIGVHCVNSTKEAFSSGKKMQAKVLQKYIERPLLLRMPGPAGKLEARKFDIRQWVLVTT